MLQDSEPTSRGHIITFYSFKGGTGRTMAVANVAWILASNGNRVLAVDWDLESPGLHHYFRPFLADKKLRHSRGVIDMIRDFAAAAVDPRAGVNGPDWYRRYADVEREAVSLSWRFPARGGIDLLPAGQQDPSYSSTVNTFDWAAFYDRLNGNAFLQALRDNMRERYDYILIDSRTGLSDSAGTCTVNMPDTVVDCFTLNDQSIDGAAAVAESILGLREREPVRLLPVPMRVEDAELFKLEAGRDYARRRFQPYLGMDLEAADIYWGDVEIPYKPFFAYEEILAAFGERSRQEHSLLSAFERLVGVLTNGDVTELPAIDERDRRRWLSVYERQKPGSSFETVISYASIDRTWADWIANELEEIGQPVLLREIDLSADAVDAAASVAAIQARLDAGARVVVVLSQDYVRSPGAAMFWQAVDDRDPTGQNLIPIRIDSSRISAPFADRHALVDLVNLAEDRARHTLLSAFDQPYPLQAGPSRPGLQGPRFPATSPPIWSVPQRNPIFTGRSAILEGLRNRLSTTVTAVMPQALFGLSGVGKTQVALEYAHRFAADYDIVWWISAEQPALVRAALAELGERLGLPPGATVNETAEAVLDALRRGEPYRRWLLVFDNADSPEAIQAFLPQGPGHILLTSRNRAWGRQATAVEVDVFERDESVALLRRQVSGLSLEDADLLAEQLGDLPLVIEQAGAWLAATAMPVSRYLDLLETQLPKVLSENPPPGYEQTPAATWRLSLERIREHMPAAARLVEVCAFFAPEPIPTQWLSHERFVGLLAPLDPTLSDPLLVERLVQEIGKYALIRIDSGQASIELHRLVQAVIRDGLPAQERAQNRKHVHEILAAVNPKDPDEPANWPAYRRIRRHLEPTGTLDSMTQTVRQLVADMVRYLWNTSDYQGSQDLGERALTAWRSANAGADDLVTLRLRLELANPIRSQAKYVEAQAIDEDVYRALLEQQGADHPYTIRSISGRAADLRGLGRYQEAHALDIEALDRSLRVHREDNPSTHRVMNNLAVSLRLIGDFAGAADLDERTYRASRGIYADRSPPVQPSVRGPNLGRDYRDLGQFEDARVLLEQTRELSKKVRGEEHSETFQVGRLLAVTYRKLGEIALAHALTREVLPGLERRLGSSHPDTLACLNDLASTLSALGDDRGARRTAEQALRKYQDRLGPDHAFTLACENNLAIFMRKLGDEESARPLTELVVERFTAKLGSDHPYTLACLVNKGNELFDLGDHQAAAVIDRDVRDRLVRVLGADHPDALAAANNLAISMRAIGDRSRANDLAQTVLDRSKQKLGPEHPNTVAVRNGTRLNCDIDPPQT